MTAKSPRVALDYLGCKVNQAEIEEMGQNLRGAGYVLAPADEKTDVYILNSCTVTHVADRKARLLIHQMARRNPNTLIIVTGCYATIDPAAVQAIEGVDLVVANENKQRLVEIVGQMVRPSPPAPPPTAGEGGAPAPSPLRGEGWGEGRSPLARTRAVLKVQDGCNHFCTYCIVPAARGGCRSTPIPAVIEKIQQLVARGCQEVVLAGVALGSYGSDWGQPNALTHLAAAILRETEVPRLRLSSIEPENLDPAMLDLWRDSRFCRHLHLPLQSGCDATLKRMGRRYRVTDYAEIVARAQSITPDVAITTDVIAGFPGESEAEFAESIAFARSMAFAKIHVFRFSARRSTPATHLPGRVSETEKKQRSAAMLALSEQSSSAYRRRFIGATLHVLWEERCAPPAAAPGASWWSGLTGNYLRVYTQSNADLRNRLDPVRLTAEMADGLMGQIQ